MAQIEQRGSLELRDLETLDLTRGQAIEIMTQVSPGSQTLEIFSRPRLSSASWVLNSRCKMLHGYPDKSISIPACDQVLKSYDRDFIYRLSARMVCLTARRFSWCAK